jgi:polyisoprenoid-binding protein YceI
MMRMKYNSTLAIAVATLALGLPLAIAAPVAPAVKVAAAPTAAAPTAWTADPAKSTLEFSFVQAGAQTTGRFARFMANIDFTASNPATGKFDVNIDVGSVDTRDKDRDTQLRETELFDVMKFPRAQYLATQFTAKGTSFEGVGQLSLRGVTKEVPITFTFETLTESGQPVAYLKGKANVKRLTFGVGQGEWKSTEWIADGVDVTFNLRLQPRAAKAAR